MGSDISKNTQIPNEIDPAAVPFMNYGIVNRYNYKPELFQMIPIKRWDPLAFNYGVNPKYGTYSYVTGHFTYISPIRGDRPIERTKDVDDDAPIPEPQPEPGEGWEKRGPFDPFEPMFAGKHYITEHSTLPAHAIIIADATRTFDDVFSETPRTYSNLTDGAVTMINKFPAMVRVIDPEILPDISNRMAVEDISAKIAQGVCTVTLPRKYYTHLHIIPTPELQAMFLSMQIAIKGIINAAENRQIVSMPISAFFNVGKLAGGSMKRIHSQMYFDMVQDGHGARMETLLQAFEKMKKNNRCHLDDSIHGSRKRLVLENEDWVMFTTGSPLRNYHLRFSPKEHLQHLGLVTPKQFFSLSDMLRTIFRALDVIGVNPNRNIILNTRPYGYTSDFHIFGDILPHEFVGGAEMADDMRVVRFSPVETAEKLRETLLELPKE
jgi:UDPglucose--hexose-1-phosphate uridylyltransferase